MEQWSRHVKKIQVVSVNNNKRGSVRLLIHRLVLYFISPRIPLYVDPLLAYVKQGRGVAVQKKHALTSLSSLSLSGLSV